ncbi:MAG TPA: carboxypeptidase-like regulatory domain-containing protein [Bryobacteraceae bacterium]|nr:carboxypeptidase-like regulatory domain-containing protein [Bryobacteraceae bacterium]
MRLLKFCLLLPFLLAPALAQDQPSAPSPSDLSDTNQPGAIQGTVLSDATSEPLRRAQVLLRGADAKTGGSYETTDETGSFSFPKVAPGRYSITVQREGYLTLSAGRIGAYKMPPVFTVQPGQTIDSFVFRMTPWGIVSGRVKFNDAEPAVNVVVQLYREFYDRGQHGYVAAASARTDDRGEYRVHGLEAGSYYIAALYQSPPRPAGAQEQIRTDATGASLPEMNYAVTFFPDAHRMADAVAVHVTAGQEVAGNDIFLGLVHTVRIHGRVLSSLTGKVLPGALITLRWNDPYNTASVSAPVNVTTDANQNFEIEGVTPGPYLVVATAEEAGKTLTARVPINVGDSDLSGLDVVVSPESIWKGKIRMDGEDATLPKGLAVALEPRRPTASPARADVSPEGDFSVAFVPNEVYDLYVLNAPNDVYLKSVQVAGAERLALGLEASPGAVPAPLDVLLSIHGGQLVGRVVTTDSQIVASGANVLLIPDPPQGRVQAYKAFYADEQGNFFLQGIAPGMYLVVAWFDQPPCQVYNPDDLATCRAQGSPVTLTEDGQETVQVTAR